MTDREAAMTALAIGLVLFGAMGAAVAASNTWQRSADTQLITDTGLTVEFASDARENFSTTAPFPDQRTVSLQRVNISGFKGTAEVQDLTAEEVAGNNNGTHLRTQRIQPNGYMRINHTGGHRRYFFAPYQDVGTVTNGGVITGPIDLKPANTSTELFYSGGPSSVQFVVLFNTNYPSNETLVAFDKNRQQALDSAVVQQDGDAAFVLPAKQDVAINFKNATDSLSFADSNGTTYSGSCGNFTAEIRFYELFPRGDRIWVRNVSVTNGSVDFSGIPSTIPLTVNADPECAYPRLTLLKSLEEQNKIYFINESEYPNAPIVRFKVEDRSGEFDDQATLRLLRGINTSDSKQGQLEYQVMAGDILGVSRSVSVRLIPGERYRIELTSASGERRLFGPFVARSSKEVVLEVGGLDFTFQEPEDGAGLNVSRRVYGSGGDKRVRLVLRYFDPQNATTNFEATIHERGNESNVLTTLQGGSVDDPLGKFAWTSAALVNESANTSWVVDYRYRRNGTVTTGTINFGPRKFAGQINFPLGDGWRAIVAVGFLLVLGGVFSVGNARIGAIMIPGVALFFWQVGFLDGQIQLASVGIAAAVGTAYNIVVSSEGVGI